MADIEKNIGGTPKHSRFRKSTVVGTGKDHQHNGGSGRTEPVLPMFIQMNIQWEGVDKAWREASR